LGIVLCGMVSDAAFVHVYSVFKGKRDDNMTMIKKEKRPLAVRLAKEWKRDWILYVLCLPPAVYVLINNYFPMYGILMAFKRFNVKLGILNSPWVGFRHFERFFSNAYFGTMVKNTLGLSLYSLVVGFTFPIIFALMLNYLQNARLKKTVQMLSYAPHFLSTVIVCSMVTLFSAKAGVFNAFRGFLGMEAVNFLSVPEWFNDLYVWSGVWQGTGWSAIIYLSALAGVDPSLHEAAIIDGATKIQRMRYVDLPSIKPTIVMLLILRMGSIMSVGFEKVYLLQNSLNYRASVIISTYTYEVGLLDGNYSLSTAVGLVNNLINIALLVLANLFSKKVLDESLF